MHSFYILLSWHSVFVLLSVRTIFVNYYTYFRSAAQIGFEAAKVYLSFYALRTRAAAYEEDARIFLPLHSTVFFLKHRYSGIHALDFFIFDKFSFVLFCATYLLVVFQLTI